MIAGPAEGVPTPSMATDTPKRSWACGCGCSSRAACAQPSPVFRHTWAAPASVNPPESARSAPATIQSSSMATAWPS